MHIFHYVPFSVLIQRATESDEAGREQVLEEQAEMGLEKPEVEYVENGVRLRYFFILLLRPPTRFFSTQLYDKVPREVNSWFLAITADYPERGGQPIPKPDNHIKGTS